MEILQEFNFYFQNKNFEESNKIIINFLNDGSFLNLKIALAINPLALKKIEINLLEIPTLFIYSKYMINYLECINILFKYNYDCNFQDVNGKNILHHIMTIDVHDEDNEQFRINELSFKIFCYVFSNSKNLFYQKDNEGKYAIEYGIHWITDKIWIMLKELDFSKAPILNNILKSHNFYSLVHDLVFNQNDENSQIDEESLYMMISNEKNLFFGQDYTKSLCDLCILKQYYKLFDFVLPFENPKKLLCHFSYIISNKKLNLLPLSNENYMNIFLEYYCEHHNNYNISENEHNNLCDFFIQKLFTKEIPEKVINLVYKLCNKLYRLIENFISLNDALLNEWSFVVLQQCRYNSDYMWQPIDQNFYMLEDVIHYLTPREIISFLQVYKDHLDDVLINLSQNQVFLILEYFKNFTHQLNDLMFELLEKIYFYYKNDDLILKMIECNNCHNLIRRYIEEGNYHILENIKDNQQFSYIYLNFYPNYKKVNCPVCRLSNNVSFNFPLIKGCESICCVCLINNAEIFFPQCCHVNTCDDCFKKL